MRILTPEQKLAKLAVPPAIKNLKKSFTRAEVYIVGGSVRDVLISRQPNDIDFVVRHVSYAKLAQYLNQHGTAQYAGRRFGVIKYFPKSSKEVYDVALPRLEHSLYLKGGYRDFAVHTDPRLPLAEDLKRRDFTVNAMAWDIYKKKLVDPSGGIDDLASRLIRAVGNPLLRFQEDYTRLLRALRLAVQLDFSVEPGTWQSVRGLISHLNDSVLPRESVASELVKMFQANPTESVDILDLSGALRVLIPEALEMKTCPQPEKDHGEGTVWDHARLSLEAFHQPELKKLLPKFKPDAELYFATWLHDIGKVSTQKMVRNKDGNTFPFWHHDKVGVVVVNNIATRLKLSSANGQIIPARLAWLVRYHLLRFGAKTMDMLVVDQFLGNPKLPSQKLLALMFADCWASRPKGKRAHWEGVSILINRMKLVKQRGYSGNKPTYLLSGEEVMTHLNVLSGPKVGNLLTQLRLRQLNGQIKTKTGALAFLKKQA
ncbi:MAG: HD domain-containing protein [bacterium]